MITSERGGQFYVTRNKYDEISDYIQNKRKEGYFVVDFDRGNGVYVAILEKNCGITEQRIVFSKAFNENSIIKEWWDKGYNLSGLEYDDVDWIYVFSKYDKKYAQAFNYDSSFPSDSISERWDKGYSISKLCYGNDTWVVVFTKGIDYHPGWSIRNKLDLTEMNKWIEDGKIITDLVFGDGRWAMTYGKHQQFSYQTIITATTFPSDIIKHKWDNGYDLSLCAYGDGQWVLAFSTKNKAAAINKDQIAEEEQTLESLTEMHTLYKNDKHADVIAFFEKNRQLLNKEEEAVNQYLWSLWMQDGSEQEAYELAKEYQVAFKTDRWLRLRGHYCKWKKWYDYALTNYQNSPKDYAEIKKIFDDYQALVVAEDYEAVIDYFESTLHLSVSKNHLDIARSYCSALYQNSGTEQKALDKLEEFLEKYPKHLPFVSLAGYISKYLGERDNDLQLLEKAMSYFKKAKKKAQQTEVRELINSTKKALKAAEKAEKADQKLLEHYFKTARGMTFCKHCGRDKSWSSFDCTGRKNGHNYTAQKIDDEWQPTCTKCGRDKSWADYSCG